MDVKVYRLLSGEEIIGYIKREMEDHVVLAKPHAMVLQQHPETGKPVLMFAPIMISTMSEGEAKIYRTAIAIEPVKVPDQIEKGFMNQTSLIQQPTAEEKSSILSIASR